MVNKIYVLPETAIVWAVSGGNHVLTLSGLAAAAVRVGDRHDFGVAARSRLFEWFALIDGFDTAPVVAEGVDFYGASSNGTIVDGGVGAVDAPAAVTDLPNLRQFLGTATVQTIVAADDLETSGVLEISSRFWSPVIHNNTVDALLGTADAHQFILIPVPDEIQ